MIIGTAGHIDHGKTSLVRALTGVETDRLPEEKRRGISIELGYAYLHPPGGPSLGFVDVPGHERLLHTMLAGATGIAHALLIVAADDGVMPQTREHLAVVALLGVTQGSVAITKIDRLDPATRATRLAEVQAEVRALLAPTALAHAPMFPVSAITGDGVEALREHLLACAAAAGSQCGPAGAQAARHDLPRHAGRAAQWLGGGGGGAKWVCRANPLAGGHAGRWPLEWRARAGASGNARPGRLYRRGPQPVEPAVYRAARGAGATLAGEKRWGPV